MHLLLSQTLSTFETIPTINATEADGEIKQMKLGNAMGPEDISTEL